MLGWKNTQGHGLYSRLTPQKVLRTCERSIRVIGGLSLGSRNEIGRQKGGLGSVCVDVGRHRDARDRGIYFLFALDGLGEAR